MTLSLKLEHQLFLAELIKDPDRRPGPAYARVYKVEDGKKAHNCGHRILKRKDVAAERARLEAIDTERRGISSEEVVREITMLAKADPRGLFEVYRGACRYCHGVGHLYHRTPREFREAWDKYMADHGGKDPAGLLFNHQGGIGFNQRYKPHPECPECFGLGEVYEYIKDSREWTPGAARLFGGLQRTRDGLKISTRSQDHALKLAAQLHHLLVVPLDGDGSEDTPPPSSISYQAKDASKAGRKR